MTSAPRREGRQSEPYVIRPVSDDGFDVRDAKESRIVVLGTASMATGWTVAIGIYLAPEPSRILPLMFLTFSPFLVWLGGYLLMSPFFREWEGWKRALLVSIFYVAIGTVLITAAVDARGFAGVPPLVLIWPIGYVFILFSEQLFDVSELYRLLWVGLGIILSLGLVSSGLLWFRQGMGGYHTPG